MKILYVQPGPGLGGSKISLYHMLRCAPPSQKSFFALSAPAKKEYEFLVKDHVEKIFYLDLPTWQKYQRRTWAEKIRAPFGNAYRIISSIPAAINLLKIIKVENIDLVHTNNSISPVGALAAWLTKTPHVWHIREAFGSKRQYRPILGDAISFWLMKRLSKVIICNSSYTAEPFRDCQIPHLVIQNGINMDDYLESNNRGKILRSNFRINDCEIAIGMIGNLTTILKRHNIFLVLASELIVIYKNLKFIIFGGSKNLNQTDYTIKLAEQAAQLGIKKQVIWADFIDDTGAMMNCLDILVHPALTEGSGRVIMEAMAAGKPVVAMKSGGVQELIEDGKTGFLINPENIKELSTLVSKLVGDSNLRKFIGEKAKEYALDHFSDHAMMNAIVQIYNDLI